VNCINFEVLKFQNFRVLHEPRRHFTTLRLSAGGWDSVTSPLNLATRKGSLGLRMPEGSPIRINITPLRVSGSVGLKHRPRWDVAVGTHTPLAPGTRVGNPSHHHRLCHAWGTLPNNIMTLPWGKHLLVRTLFTM
jgi:hypothetical protein